ncbi:MAG: DNA polymerase III subunit delta [Butyrivibrio sp.]|nr:DNA polymerase III subunit delta [Butyrivibrio sp.]
MKEIAKHIKNNSFAAAYLLFGDEDYLKTTYKNRLREAICGGDAMNLSVYTGKDVPVSEIADLARTMPFFAERRLIVIEDSGLFKSSSEEMAELVRELPDTAVIVFVESEVDKRQKLYKAVNEKGYVCEMKRQTEAALRDWAVRIFGAEGKRITRSDMERFLERAGDDMNNIYNEAHKLISYTGDADVILARDIDAVCPQRPEDRVFDMINAMSSGKRDEAVRLYSDLLALREPPMKLLTLIARQLSTLMSVKDLCGQGKSGQEIAARLGLRPFFVGRYISQAKSFSAQSLRQAVNDCVEAETAVKTGRTEDKYAVELIILKYSAH